MERAVTTSYGVRAEHDSDGDADDVWLLSTAIFSLCVLAAAFHLSFSLFPLLRKTKPNSAAADAELLALTALTRYGIASDCD